MQLGLPHRRMIKDFQENYYPKWLSELHSVMGFQVPVEVAWDTLFFEVTDNASLESLSERWKLNFFEGLTEGFKLIAVDQMGKDALKDKIKSIKIQGGDARSPDKSTLKDGVLSSVFSPFNGNYSYAADLGKDWATFLEPKL